MAMMLAAEWCRKEDEEAMTAVKGGRVDYCGLN
jgi:hypothetical protein